MPALFEEMDEYEHAMDVDVIVFNCVFNQLDTHRRSPAAPLLGAGLTSAVSVI